MQLLFWVLFQVGFVAAQSPNLYVHKKINNSHPILNEVVAYTVVVGNDGDAAATGVVVRDNLPAGAQYTDHTVFRGANAYSSVTGNWNIGSLTAGDSVVMELKARVVARGVWFNTAEVIQSQGGDPNSSPNNQDLSEDDMALVCFSVPIEWYEGDEFTVSIPIALTNVQWTRNGQSQFPASQAVATGSTLVIKSPGNYSFTGMFGNCPVNGCCAIEVVPGPVCQLVPTAQATPTCEASPLVLTASGQGGSQPYQYRWSGPNGFTSTSQNPTIPVATTANAGVYTVYITDAVGCTATASTTALVGSLPTAVCNSPVCEGATIYLSATGGGTGYLWLGPNGFTSTLQSPTIPNATTANSGSYTVVITGTSICSGTAITSLKVLPKPTIDAMISSSACVGGSFTLSATASGGVEPYSYIWTGPNGFYETGQTVVVNNAQLTHAGSYTLTVFSQNGCGDKDVTAPILIKACVCNPVAGALSASVCVGQTVSLTATNGFNSYNWKGPSGFTSNQQNPVIPNAQLTQNGNYTLTVTGTQCTGTAIVPIAIIGLPVADATSSTVCVDGVASISLSVSGGSSYQWSGPNGFVSSEQSPIISNATSSQSGVYSVTVINGSGCSVTRTTSVSVGRCGPPVSCSLTGSLTASSTVVCAGGSVVLTASGSGNQGVLSYQWLGAGVSGQSGSSVTVSNLTSTSTFTVVISDGGVSGCSLTRQITVGVNPLPVEAEASSSTACVGNSVSIQLSASSGSGYSYKWSGPNGFVSSEQSPIISNATSSQSGVYSVTVISGSGCSVVRTTSVSVGLCVPPVSCSLTGSLTASSTVVCAGGSVVLTASGSGNQGVLSYQWLGAGVSGQSGSS
ncbi:hypothetical protein ACO2Q8_20445, partial [Larkinella sp. VNQ87]